MAKIIRKCSHCPFEGVGVRKVKNTEKQLCPSCMPVYRAQQQSRTTRESYRKGRFRFTSCPQGDKPVRD